MKMPPKDIIWIEQEESLSIWCSSEELVLVKGEHDVVMTDKRTVLETYLSKAASNFSKTFHAHDPALELLENNKRLASENRKLRKELKAIADRIEAVENQVSALTGEEKVIVLRTITKEEAKDEIKELFDAGRVLYYSDIADELRIDLELAVEICQELENEGEIEVSGDSKE